MKNDTFPHLLVRIEAINLRNNLFKVVTTHVDLSSIWLHPKMVDFSRSITVTPDIVTALRSFERREDWGS